MNHTEPDFNSLTAELLALVEDDNQAAVLDIIQREHPSEIARLLSSMPVGGRLPIWQLIPIELKTEVVAELNEDIRVGLLEQTDINDLVKLTDNMDLDDLTDLLQDLPEALYHVVLESLKLKNRHQVEEILSYPEDTAGGLMNLDIIKVRPNVSLDTVHRYLRKLGSVPESTDKLMVVDRNNLLLGTLHMAAILTHSGDALVRDIMNQDAVVIDANLPDTEVANIFQGRDLLSAPVVDGNNKILGRITVDDVVDVIHEDAGQTIMARDGLAEEDDIFSTAFVTAKRRNLWLGVHLLAALVSAYIIGLFEHSIKEVIALAVLMPLVASMSGVAGSQTLTLTIRGMALNQVNAANLNLLFNRETTVGLINGILWGLVIAVIAYLWFNNLELGLVIIITILINIVIATVSGVAIPVVQKKLNIDPALAGHVALTALTDAVGFLSFLGLATIFLL